jgi:hypothetical protein
MRSFGVRPRLPPRGRRSRLASWIAILSGRGVRGRVGLLVFLVLALIVGLVALAVGTWKPQPSDHRIEGASLFERLHLPAAPSDPAGSGDRAPPALVGELAAQRNAGDPFHPLGAAAKPFVFTGPPEERLRARTCLAAAMLYEAGSDAAGQLAVAQVVLNRVRHPAFPASVCGVVTQGSERATGCQFTFTCDGSLARRIAPPAQTAAYARADAMLSGLVYAAVGLATHYHTHAVYPWWSPRLEKIAQVGPHLFFRWPGHWGSPQAMIERRAGHEPSAALFAGLSDGLPQALAVGASEPRIDAYLPGLDEALPVPVARPLVASRDDRAVAIPEARRLAVAPVPETPAAAIGARLPGGHRLLRMFPEEGLFYLELAPGSSDASRRRAAELLCGGRAACRVYGWHDASLAPHQPQLDAAARSALAFRFVRTPPADRQSVPPSANAL